MCISCNPMHRRLQPYVLLGGPQANPTRSGRFSERLQRRAARHTRGRTTSGGSGGGGGGGGDNGGGGAEG